MSNHINIQSAMLHYNNISKVATAILLSSCCLFTIEATQNLALETSGTIASASSVEVNTPACPGTESCAPGKAIDGDPVSRWAGLKPAGQSVEWFQLELTDVYEINKIVLEWEAAYATEYDIQVKTEPTDTWIEIHSQSSGTGGTETIDLASTESGKFIRLNFYARSKKRFGHSLYEIKVYGPNTVSQPTDQPSTSSAPSVSLQPVGTGYENPNLPVEERVADLLGKMSLDDKIGQMTQVERKSLNSIDDIANYRLGSLLSGGGSYPNPNTPAAWANMYDEYQTVAVENTPHGVPLIYGVDAVHGHSNVVGATIFPHNIGLGATRNATLLEEIGKITAKEVYATGIPWNFSPCLVS